MVTVHVLYGICDVVNKFDVFLRIIGSGSEYRINGKVHTCVVCVLFVVTYATVYMYAQHILCFVNNLLIYSTFVFVVFR